MNWMWDKHFKDKGCLEPSFKQLGLSLLELALRRLKNPRDVWKIFNGLNQLDCWRESREWAFYMELREHLDAYFAEHTSLLKKIVLQQIGKVGREYATVLLHNVIDRQCILFLNTGEGCSTRCDVAATCLEALRESDRDWCDFLIQTNDAGSSARQMLPGTANEDEYESDRRRNAVELLGKLLLLISKHQDAGGSVTGVGAIGKERDDKGVHPKIFKVMMCVLQKERERFNDLKKKNKAEKSIVLVRLLETLHPFLSLATEEQSSNLLGRVINALEERFPGPDELTRMSVEEKGHFTPLFTALLRLIRDSRSPKVLPLIRKFLLNEVEHPYKDDIQETLKEYIVQMPEEIASATAFKILQESHEQESLNPNVLRIERSVVEFVCCGILGRLSEVYALFFLV